MNGTVVLWLASSAVAFCTMLVIDEIRRRKTRKRKPNPSWPSKSKVSLEGDLIVVRWRDHPCTEAIRFGELESVHLLVQWFTYDPWNPDLHWVLRDGRQAVVVSAWADDLPVLESLLKTLPGFDEKALVVADDGEHGTMVECWRR